MTRFLIRILISIVIGWMIGVQAAFTFGPEGNLTPMLYIFGAVPFTYLATFLIVPLLSGWLDRLR
jgi:ABC-type anion transport system duplicated permease subunit